jgi:hypothetical protein
MSPSMFLAAITVLAAASSAFSQTTAAQFTGRVTDPTGAVIANAKVVATNTATGVTRETESNDAGSYTVPLLEPGSYSVNVKKAGFRPIAHTGLTLHVNQMARMDFVMELGSVTETVSVNTDLPLLQSAESSLNAVIDNRKVVELPLNGRNPFDLMFLAAGTQSFARPSYPGNNIPLSNFSINGGPAMSNEVLLDGIPNTTPQYNAYAIIPSIDAVQEFEVKTNNMAAEFGRTSGGVINVSMKSGANAFHGVAYDFLRNDALDSNTWLNNKSGLTNPALRYNQFGATAGGRIVRDKTFFFANYEGLRRSTGRTFQFSVPTLDQRRGDFSRTLAQNGRLVDIYDPLSVTQAGTGFVRTTFPGNVIPNNRFNTVSKNILPFWNEPTHPGIGPTLNNNFIKNSAEAYTVNQFNTRVDHSFSNSNRLFGRFSWNESWVTPPVVFSDTANPASGPQLFTQRNAALNDTHSFSANTFATFRLGFARLRDYNNPLDTSFDITKLGLPAYVRDLSPARTFPSVNVSGYAVSNIGFGTSSVGPVTGTIINNISNSYTAQSDVTHTRGNHVFKAGLEYRLFRSAGFRPPLPAYNFSPGWTQGPNPLQGSVNAGNAFASFLVGLTSGGSAQLNATQDIQTYYYGAFLQDDYKLTPRLTLNLGLRFETENLRTDRYDRLNFLDLTSQSPLAVPSLGPLRGGLAFVGVGGNSREQGAVAYNWSPRFGFAYQFHARTVFRGGYGIFFAPRTGFDFGTLGQTGFSATTDLISSPDGVTPTTYYSNPFPNGLVQPTGSSLGLLTNVGAAISAPDYNQQALYMQHWNLSLQRQLAGSMVIDIAYAGSKGTHLWQNLQFNQLPDKYLALKSDLQRVVPNPFRGIIPATQALGGATTTYGQLLRPYPQFTGVNSIGSTSGSSTYHALEIRAEKRYSHGVNFLASYTLAKQIDDGAPGARIAWIGDVPNFQNNNDRRSERSVNSQMAAQRLSIAAGWELPFGKGKLLASGISPLTDKVIGGWQINWIGSFQGGIPLVMSTAVNNTNSYGGGSRPNSTGKSANLSGPIRDRLDRYFDTSAFTQPDPFTFGNVSRTLPDVRGPGSVNSDISLLKNIPLTERFRVQFRAEAFNIFNNVNFGNPGTSVGGANYGVITSAGGARVIQLALKFYY